ncbi:SET domain-containing protein-lysine N-methyltransferase [Candidatus Nomurabacteria bacterium]|nr:MAG: SET domain-containing protein-lysine N-methyltransferase [Candidatus Nomurabacteria bacterium]
MNSNLAPEIFRKRLIIEGKYTVEIKEEQFVTDFLSDLSRELGMTIIAGPFISSATGKSVPLHDGYEGSLVWAESGANTYIWTRSKFCTVDIYSCKEFDSEKAISFIKERFGIIEFSYFELPDPMASKQDSRIVLRQSENKGNGVFANKAIPQGTVVSYVDGQIHYAQKESEVYVHASNHAVPFHKYFYRNGFNTDAVKLNHSCEPNCYVKDLFFVTTMRDIQAGEELTYCYGLFCNSDWENPEGVCHCGSKECLGKILPWRELPQDFKIKYFDYTADWILFDEIKNKGLLEELKKSI